MRLPIAKNRSLKYFVLGGVASLIVLYVILSVQVPAVKMRVFVFALWVFGEIYLWITILKSFKNTWKRKTPFIVLLFIYWLPACLIAIAMGMLAAKGVHQLNKTLYLTVVGVCIIQYLIKFLLFILIFVYDVIVAFVLVFLTQRAQSPEFNSGSQRTQIKKGLLRVSLGIYIVALLLMIYGTIWGADDFRVREITVSGVRHAVCGERCAVCGVDDTFKIVLLSDLHLACWRNFSSVEQAIKMVNEQQPDIIFIVGDFVQFVSEEIVDYLPILSQLVAKYGIYTVLGNHDYGRYARFDSDALRKQDVQKLINYQTSIGWRTLNNESVRLFADSIPMGITIAGVEFYSPKKMFINEGNLLKTFENVDSNDYVILLSHDPQAWYDVVDKNLPANLTLSGHTHGMQLGIYSDKLKFSPASLLYKQWGGLYEKQGKLLYVNVGLGSVGFPARVGMPPEITVIRLGGS
jgi:predicted MPP superfamily phosphohydrolase